MTSNIAIEAMKNLILEKFSLVQIITDSGLLKKIKMNQKYENALKDVDKQFERIMVGLERLDTAEDPKALKAISTRILTIIEEDLPNAMGVFMRAYINALAENFNHDHADD